jgi:hypothetical protein
MNSVPFIFLIKQAYSCFHIGYDYSKYISWHEVTALEFERAPLQDYVYKTPIICYVIVDSIIKLHYQK